MNGWARVSDTTVSDTPPTGPEWTVAMHDQTDDFVADLRERAARQQQNRQHELHRELAEKQAHLARLRELILHLRRLADGPDDNLWEWIESEIRWENPPSPNAAVFAEICKTLPVHIAYESVGVPDHNFETMVRTVWIKRRDGTTQRIPIGIQRRDLPPDSDGDAIAELVLWQGNPRPDDALQAMARVLDELEAFADEAEACEGPIDCTPYVAAVVMNSDADERPAAAIDPPAEGEDEHPTEDIVLTANDEAVLTAMAEYDGSRLLTIADISREARPAVSERTAGGCIRKLIGHGLAERPGGQRQGARLTIPGRRHAHKIAD